MKAQELKEKYFRLKGMFLELKESLEKTQYNSIGLGLCGAHTTIHFDDFKLEIHSEKCNEILLRLYSSSKEVANINIEEKDDFKFFFDESVVDFIASYESR